MSSRHAADESLQILGSAWKEVSSLVAVGIDVSDGVLLQLVQMGFYPFDRTQQTRLFAVPRAIDDGTLRSPALAMQLTQHARFFQQRGLAGDGIVGAVDPGVVMIAANDPLAIVRAVQGGDHIVDRFHVPVGSDFEVHLGRARPDVIGDGKAPRQFSGATGPLSAERSGSASA